MENLPGFKWINFIKQILIECGKWNLWIDHDKLSTKSIKSTVKQILIDQSQQCWHSTLQNSPKVWTSHLLKTTLNLNHIWQIWINAKLFICSNSGLVNQITIFPEILTGGKVMTKKIEPVVFAKRQQFSWQISLTFKVHFYSSRKLIGQHHYISPSPLKYKQLLNCTSIPVLKTVCKFIKILIFRLKMKSFGCTLLI